MQNDYLNANRASWDLRTETHKDSEFYDLEGFKKGKNSLNNIELEALGDVDGRSMLHLQCHFGQDSLSWARLGAEVTGLDLSPKAIDLARALSRELQIPARFVESDLYSAPEKIDGKFDLVFTSYGTYGWLPDLERWAAVIEHFLKPGGVFYIVDFHPTLYLFDFDSGRISYEYFNRGEPYVEESEGTYADPQAKIRHTDYFWSHSLEEVISPFLKRGLQLEDFREFDYSPYNCFPNMVERAPGEYVYDKAGVRLPHLFSLKCRKRKEERGKTN
ncbi:MAG: methyltransferase domain-containing protein [Saprospiraceae bacterium]|nr:methyltransferase domain-containing protein [Saprospiraceae bacterium]MCB0623062.1 methyltransferase domain-containing protein [Saprospiraceae bacterium]